MVWQTVLVVALILFLLSAIPVGRRNPRAGYGLGGLIMTLLLVFGVLWLLGVV